jgi:hypothetical protein
LGLIDGLGDMRGRMRELYGPKIELRAVSLGKPGLLARLRRGAPTDVGHGSAAIPAWLGGGAWADDAMSALETRALWARFGL